MKKTCLYLFITALALTHGAGIAHAQETDGSSCELAIALGSDYHATILTAGDVWYRAQTFDLPLAVYFIPNNWDDAVPTVEMDFSCTSGVYDDEILCSLFCKVGGSMGVSFSMPHRPPLQKTKLGDGRDCYALAMGEDYRDLLFQAGITYSVDVYIKVHYNGPGYMSMAPNNLFANCMDDGEWMSIGKVYELQATDEAEKDTFFVAPFCYWQNDSVEFSWTGNEYLALSISGTCDFDPDDDEDENILIRDTVRSDKTLRYTSPEMKYYVDFFKGATEAGLFYLKARSKSAGELKVKRIAAAPAAGGAKLMKYNQLERVANEKQLFAISRSWTTATRFMTPTNSQMQMVLSTDAGFANTLKTYNFTALTGGGQDLCLQAEDMQTLWKEAKGNYLYVHFVCAVGTTVTPEYWYPGDCQEDATYIPFGTQNMEVNIMSKGLVYYRMNLGDWLGGNLTISMSSTTSNCRVFVGDTCSFQVPESGESSDEHVHAQGIMNKNTPTITYTADELALWQDWADADNNVYLFFNPKVRMSVSFASTRESRVEQREEAPEGVATIAIECRGDELVVRVNYLQTMVLLTENERQVCEPWEQSKDEEHVLPKLDPGVYVLRGEKDEVRLKIED